MIKPRHSAIRRAPIGKSIGLKAEIVSSVRDPAGFDLSISLPRFKNNESISIANSFEKLCWRWYVLGGRIYFDIAL